MSAGIEVGVAKSVKETDRALLIELEDDEGRQSWIPKSQIHDDSEVFKDGQRGRLVVTTWFAEQKGWS